MSAGALDALFGIVQSDGDEVELGGGLNFTGGLAAEFNQSTGVIDVTLAGAGEASIIDYDNAASGLAASNVQDAIDEIAGWGWSSVLENGANSGGHDVTIDADDAFIFERGAAHARMVASVDIPGGIDLENDGGSAAGFLFVDGATRGALYTVDGSGTTLEAETGRLLLNAADGRVDFDALDGFDFERVGGGPVVITVTDAAPVVTWTTEVGSSEIAVTGALELEASTDLEVEAGDDVFLDAGARIIAEAATSFAATGTTTATLTAGTLATIAGADILLNAADDLTLNAVDLIVGTTTCAITADASFTVDSDLVDIASGDTAVVSAAAALSLTSGTTATVQGATSVVLNVGGAVLTVAATLATFAQPVVIPGGTGTASTGSLRTGDNFTIYGRDDGNTGNRLLLEWATDNLSLGDSSNIDDLKIQVNASGIIGFYCGSAIGEIASTGLTMVSGKQLALSSINQYLVADASGIEYHVPTGDTHEFFVNSVSKLLVDTSLVTVGAAALAIGTSTAATGALRFGNNAATYSELAAGTDSRIFVLGSDDILRVGDANVRMDFTVSSTLVAIMRSTELELQSNVNLQLLGVGTIDFAHNIALGGGAAATMGTIGGSGPTAAAQSKWIQVMVDSVNHWIPAWV
jgi:hypothetical protein